jgi:hypothetical protein
VEGGGHRRASYGRALAVALGLVLAAAAGAAAAPSPGLPAPPTTLPSAAPRIQEDGAPQWIVAGRPGPALERLARSVGARTVAAPIGLVRAPEPAAARLVGLLRPRGLLRYAEPDARARRASMPADPLSPSEWWLPDLIPAELTPPAPAPLDGPPEIAIVEDGADVTHPDLAGHVWQIGSGPPAAHGTAVASVASAPGNGIGLVGAYPGAATRVYASTTCSQTAAAVVHAADDGARVINMSYGFDEGTCYSHLLATEYAFGRGSVLVASAGNELGEGSPRSRPANDPHVLTVGAVGPGNVASTFSNRNEGVDVTAPGVDIPVAVPLLDDTDGVVDGYDVEDGTSFSAPMVSGLVAWLRRARPDLTPSQATELLRRTARDLGAPGWDPVFGWGLPDLARALSSPAPPDDPGEPNDDIEWVDGRRFAADVPALRASRVATVRAFLQREKDPVDVIPVRVPAGGMLTVAVRPRGTDVDLELLDQTARAVTEPGSRALIVRSAHPGLRVERARALNPTRKPRRIWVVVYMPGGRTPGGEYTLRMARERPSAAERVVLSRRSRKG